MFAELLNQIKSQEILSHPDGVTTCWSLERKQVLTGTGTEMLALLFRQRSISATVFPCFLYSLQIQPLLLKSLNKSPVSESPSLHLLSEHKFPTLPSTEQHPKHGHSAYDTYQSHPSVSMEKRCFINNVWRKKGHCWMVQWTVSFELCQQNKTPP